MGTAESPEHEVEVPARAAAGIVPAEAAPAGPAGTPAVARVLALQRAAGNRATAALLARRPTEAAAFGPRPSEGGRVKLVRVAVSRHLEPEEFNREFVRQFFACASDAEVAGYVAQFPEAIARATSAQEERQGWATVAVSEEITTVYDQLTTGERAQVDEETTRRIWAATGKVPAGGDPSKDALFTGTRNAVLFEDKQRRRIEALPEDVRRALFAGTAMSSLQPSDYAEVLRAADKLMELSKQEREEYAARVTRTAAWSGDLEASVDRFVSLRQARKLQERQQEEVAKPLFGTDDVYTKYKAWQFWFAAHNVNSRHDTKDDDEATKAIYEAAERSYRRAESDLLAALTAQGFDSIRAYQMAVERYRITFMTQAATLALDVLARYEGTLFQEERRLDAGAAATMVTAIGGTRAKAQFAVAASERAESMRAQTGHDPMDKLGAARDRELRRPHDERAAAAQKDAEAEVTRASGSTLVGERNVDREKIAGLDAPGLDRYLRELIAKRRDQVREARTEFEQDPERIFTLPDLVQSTMKLQQVEPDSVYGRIITDHIKDAQFLHLVSELAVGALALALAALVPGGGWIAAAALVGSAGISGYQAFQALKEYGQQERDYELGFLSEEPSLFWVGVAMVAAAVDAGIAVSVVVKESAAGLKALEGPLKAFAKDGELAKLTTRIEQAAGLRDDARVALKRAAAEQQAARESWEEFVGGVASAGANFGQLADAGTMRGLYRAILSAVRRGVHTVAGLYGEARFLKLAKQITGAAGAEKAAIEAAFKEVQELAEVAGKRGMDDGALAGFVDRLATNRANPRFKTKLLDEMKAWKPVTPAQEKAAHKLREARTLVADLNRERNELITERVRLREAQADPATRTAAARDRIKEIDARLAEFGPHQSPAGPQPGELRKAEDDFVAAERAARELDVSLYDRLRAATPTPAAHDAAMKGVVADMVGPLKTKPTGLQVDHVVPVREIVDMDGFTELTLKEQKAFIDSRENLIVMDASANGSKGDRSWRSWAGASRFYDEATIARMQAKEATVRSLLRERLDALLAAAPKGR